MMILKFELKCFLINLMLELFMCLRFELLALISYFYSLGVIIVFKFLIPFFVVYIFP
jgi:hypothetical protein